MRVVSAALFLSFFNIISVSAADRRYNVGFDYTNESLRDTLNYPSGYLVSKSGTSYGANHEAIFFQVSDKKLMAGLHVQFGSLGINHYFSQTSAGQMVMGDRQLDSGFSRDIRLGAAYRIKPYWYVGGTIFQTYVEREYTTETPLPPYVITIKTVLDSVYYGPEVLTGVSYNYRQATFGAEVAFMPIMYRRDDHKWQNGTEGRFFIQSAEIITSGERLQMSVAIRMHQKASALIMYRLRSYHSPDNSFLIAEPPVNKIPESLFYKSFSIGVIFHI